MIDAGRNKWEYSRAFWFRTSDKPAWRQQVADDVAVRRSSGFAEVSFREQMQGGGTRFLCEPYATIVEQTPHGTWLVELGGRAVRRRVMPRSMLGYLLIAPA